MPANTQPCTAAVSLLNTNYRENAAREVWVYSRYNLGNSLGHSDTCGCVGQVQRLLPLLLLPSHGSDIMKRHWV